MTARSQKPGKPRGPIGPVVRIAAGLTGGLVITMGVLAAILDPKTPRAGALLMLVMGSLFLIPALFSGPRPASRSSEAHDRLTRRVGLTSHGLMGAGVAIWACLTVIAYIPGGAPRWWPTKSSQQDLLIGASLAWTCGFLLRFFYIYYLNQDAEDDDGQ